MAIADAKAPPAIRVEGLFGKMRRRGRDQSGRKKRPGDGRRMHPSGITGPLSRLPRALGVAPSVAKNQIHHGFFSRLATIGRIDMLNRSLSVSQAALRGPLRTRHRPFGGIQCFLTVLLHGWERMADSSNPADFLRDAVAAGERSPLSGEITGSRACPTGPEARQPNSKLVELSDLAHRGNQPWHLLAIGEVCDFAALRRRLGRARADRIAADLVDCVSSVLSEMTAIPSGRSSIEIEGIVDGPAHAQSLLDALDRAMAAPMIADGEPLAIPMRFAGAVVPTADRDEICLIEAAETAIARARAGQGGNLVDLTRPDEAIDRSLLMRELPQAIEAGDLFLQYQPKIHLRHQRIASAEALIRWNHRTRGLILPGDFISAAEESGGIGGLTVWTLRQVIADQRKLRANGHDFTIFINISGQLLADRGFVDTVRTIVTGSDAAIGFEITETSVIRDPDSAIAHLRAFAEIGIPLAIDDYGAGLSSLSYLKQLPARELKIDKLFVTQLTSSNRDPLIVRSTIDLAHALDMEVTAEGVESPAALALLSVMGCDMAQGYLISRPIGVDAFITYCDEERHLEVTSNSRPGFGSPASFWRRSG